MRGCGVTLSHPLLSKATLHLNVPPGHRFPGEGPGADLAWLWPQGDGGHNTSIQMA